MAHVSCFLEKIKSELSVERLLKGNGSGGNGEGATGASSGSGGNTQGSDGEGGPPKDKKPKLEGILAEDASGTIEKSATNEKSEKNPNSVSNENATNMEVKTETSSQVTVGSNLSENEPKARGTINLELLKNWVPKYKRKKQYILFIEDISVTFDGFKALDGLTMYLTEGELRCIIGPNGAGKTTMMDVITGHTRPDSGEAWFMDQVNLLEKDEVFIAQAGICRKFQKPSVFESLSTYQNLELALKGEKTVLSTYRSKMSGEDRDYLEEVLKLTGLDSESSKLAGNLSHGQKQWLEIGMLLTQKPRILLLDEPVAGMTPQEIDHTSELLTSLEGNHTVLVVEHDMEFVRSIARQVTVLHQGRVLAEGSMEEVSSREEVITAYLGGSYA
jgi:urea transport system ATP-binding protein